MGGAHWTLHSHNMCELRITDIRARELCWGWSREVSRDHEPQASPRAERRPYGPGQMGHNRGGGADLTVKLPEAVLLDHNNVLIGVSHTRRWRNKDHAHKGHAHTRRVCGSRPSAQGRT